jgi:hypothetical protein
MTTACSASGGSHESPAASTNRSSSADGSYGSLPSFLPTPTIKPDSVLTGSPGQPAVTSQGDSVQALVHGGSVRIRVDGPLVPGEGLPKVTDATTCTWKITLSGGTVRVPLAAAQFSALDENGRAYHPEPVAGHSAPPASVEPNSTVSFDLRVVMPTGEGVMRWAPTSGKVVAVWDFVVEND